MAETETDSVETDPAESPARRDLVAVLTGVARHLWDEASDRDDPAWPPRWLVVLGASVAGIVALAVVAGLVIPLIRLVAASLAEAAGSGFTAADGRELARVVLDPVRSYLDTHAGQLPVSVDALWWAWAVFGLATALLSFAGSTGARVGWTLFGLATAGMAWAATPHPAHWIAVGVTALWWSLLSVPAFRRRRPWAPRSGIGPRAPERHEPTAVAHSPTEPAEPRDQIAAVALVYEQLLRRRWACDLILEGPGPAWTVTAQRRSFRAVDDAGRIAAGTAATPEVIDELLAAASTPPGASPTVRWTSATTPIARDLRLGWEDYREDLPRITEYFEATPDQLAQLCAALQVLRGEWDLDRVDEQIAARAAALDRTHPIIQPQEYAPEPTRDIDLGRLMMNDWVDPVTIVETPVERWNGFASHRPEIVGLIVRKLLTAEDLETAVRDILSDDGIVHLERVAGPAGPLHYLSVNGSHRTHAFRILGAPLIAAEITTRPLPLRIRPTDVWVRGFTGPVEPLWRGLIARGLLVGDIVETATGPVLEPHHVIAPWLLLDPAAATLISAAYDRVYPNALADAGIPATARFSAGTWQRWLTSATR